MDRWRWLPRDLGERYIIVNVPAYTAALVENGVTVSRHRAVSGAVKTPTPQLMAVAEGVSLNPWWEVPQSIWKEVAGKPGYVALKDPKTGKLIRWRQPPGPRNALGQVKFVMYNPHNIYLHDTTAKTLFDTKARAYSHGCIRTEHIMLLAERLLSEGAPVPGTPEAEGKTIWTPEKVRETLASRKTVQANFPKPIPVYIVYMSSAALADGSIKNYTDIYKRDGKVIAALNDVPAGPGSEAGGQDRGALSDEGAESYLPPVHLLLGRRECHFAHQIFAGDFPQVRIDGRRRRPGCGLILRSPGTHECFVAGLVRRKIAGVRECRDKHDVELAAVRKITDVDVIILHVAKLLRDRAACDPGVANTLKVVFDHVLFDLDGRHVRYAVAHRIVLVGLELSRCGRGKRHRQAESQ